MHRESMNQAQNFATIQQAQMSALLAQGQLQNQLSNDKGQQPPTQMPNPNTQGGELSGRSTIGRPDPSGVGRPICVRNPRN